ncbi:MAG TPA: signal peptide peptidase SppA [Deltaproteobacteria bacterium]|nr:signal peptide peptidase SppA [Deltaproteobacteria bacterium]
MKKIYFLVMIFLIFLAGCSAPNINLFKATPDPLREYTLEGTGAQKILLLSVDGMISDRPKRGLIAKTPSLVERIVMQLNKAQNDKQIKAVLLKVNSPGGTITASDLLYHEISSYKAKTGNKIIVSMMDVAASGAYYLSLPADMIMAHPTTVTGSVGVISLQPKVKGLMDKIGLGVDVQKTGKYKDMGSPYRETAEEERKLLQKSMDIFGQRFLNLVKEHRSLSEESLADVATARIFLAQEALQIGLIDGIGYLSDAVKETKKLAGLPENAKVIVYRRAEFPEDNYYNIAGTSAENLNISLISIELPEIVNIHAGFYYLWPAALGAY